MREGEEKKKIRGKRKRQMRSGRKWQRSIQDAVGGGGRVEDKAMVMR